MSRIPRIFAFLVVLVISILTPIFLIRTFVAATLLDLKESGNREMRAYGRGCIVQGQLWFPVSASFETGWSSDTAIRKVDLKTGVISDQQLAVLKTGYELMAVGNDAYVVNSSEIRRLSDLHSAVIPSNDGDGNRCSNLFPYEGTQACVFTKGPKTFWLARLADGKWVDRREILLPMPGDVIKSSLSPEDLQLPPVLHEKSGDCTVLQVDTVLVESAGASHELFAIARVVDSATGGANARRFRSQGFRFADEVSETASALHPVNNESISDHWKETLTGTCFSLVAPVVRDSTSLIVPTLGAARGGISVVQLRRENTDGSASTITGLSTKSRNSVLADSAQGTAYVIEEEDDGWNTATIRRIEGNKLGPAVILLRSGAIQYLARWRTCFLQILSAWLLHYLLVAFAAGCLKLGRRPIKIEFDLEQATVAPVSRRLAAAALDLFLLTSILSVIWIGLAGFVYSSNPDADKTRIASQLQPYYEYLAVVFRLQGSPGWGPAPMLFPFGISIWQIIGENRVIVASWLSTTGVILFAILLLEIRCGRTPGKWALSIQCTKPDFSPPGFLATLIRGISRPFEYLFYATPIPVMCLMLMSKRGRRFGDVLAEAIVIKIGSVRPADLDVDHPNAD